jgi:iron complex outermembrane receptor protein
VNATRLGLTIPQSTREYTLGGNATFIQSDQWTHIVVAGLDVSSISNVSDFSTPLPSATAASVGRADGKAGLTTLKGSSVGRFGNVDGIETTVTLSGENTFLDLEPASNTTAGFTAQTQPVQRLTTSGIAQANVAWRETGYLTGGLRLERNDALDNSSISLLPMLGAAAVRDFGALTVKLRSAYGRGIRPVSTPAREMEWFDPRHEARFTSLAPESQSGIEAGMDAFLGKFIGLQITRFDQRASGLVQRVAYAFSGDFSHEGPGGGSSGEGSGRVAPEDRHIDYALQNVGEITNRGWELKGDANIAALTLSGTLATVDSRVRKLAYGYTGDLKVGDRMLDVPAKTATASAIWTAPRWMASVSAARSWDWISYDRIALAGAFTNSTQTDAQLVGAQLRSYWLQYSGVTRLRASLGFSLSRALSLSVSGDNLLNYQFGEPDNVTVVPGRTISFGLRTNL